METRYKFINDYNKFSGTVDKGKLFNLIRVCGIDYFINLIKNITS